LNYLSCKRRQKVCLAFGKAPFEDDALSVDITQLAQSLEECFFAGLNSGAQRYVPDPGNLFLGLLGVC
jgi:hypothetical protein